MNLDPTGMYDEKRNSKINKKVKVRFIKDLRGGQNAEVLVGKGTTVSAFPREPANGFTGRNVFFARHRGMIIIFDESYVEMIPSKNDLT
jgi:hypothetical protein